MLVQKEPIKVLKLPDGSCFDVMQDLTTVLLSRAHDAEQAAALAAAGLPPVSEAPPAVEKPSAPEPHAKGVKDKGAKDKAVPVPPPQVAAPAVATPPPPPAAPPQPESPLALSGRPHCRQLQLPLDRFRETLEQMQVCGMHSDPDIVGMQPSTETGDRRLHSARHTQA